MNEALWAFKGLCAALVLLESVACTKIAAEFCRASWGHSWLASAAWAVCAGMNLGWIGLMVLL